jgi:hypothetical protein
MKLKNLKLAAGLSLMALALAGLPARAAVIGVQVMASDGLYFTASGPGQYWHSASGGYCGGLGPWCLPATYRWTYDNNTTYGSMNSAVWKVPTVQQVYSRAYAFVPRNNATCRTAFYTISYAGVSNYEQPLNQLAYYDQWAALFSGRSFYLASQVRLVDGQFGWNTSTLEKIAFDEIKIES